MLGRFRVMRLIVLALLLLVPIPASAGAAATGLPAGPLAGDEGDPVLVRDGAVWVQKASVIGGRPGGALRRLLRVGADDVSSTGALATVVSGDNLFTGTISDGLRQVYGPSDGCRLVDGEVEGDLVAAAIVCPPFDSGAANRHIVIRRPGRPDQTFPAGPGEVHVAGRYAAWTPADDEAVVVLYDAAADREVARAGSVAGPQVYPVELQADGKLLVGVRGDRSAWLSPSEPTLHRVDVGPGTVRAFVGDRILTSEYGHVVRLQHLDGGARRVLAVARGISEINGAHYDGTRIVLARATCNGNRILLRAAAAPRLTLRETSLCRLQKTGPLVFGFGDDRPTVSGSVRCIMETLRRCGDLVVRTFDGRRLSDGSYDGEDDGTYGISLTDGALRRIAREGSMRVKLEMRLDFGGPLLQSPTTATLRVGPTALARVRRCVRARRNPSQFRCPR